ncbi:MAG TPA: hypothetical protein VKA35_01290 [Solirubrobacterales bacterium]|nr:hypothetical protein [Solirubrobacterales bacterium]
MRVPGEITVSIAGLLVLALLSASIGGETAYAAEAPVGIACEGDECQGPAPAPEDPVPGTAVVEGPPNPPVRFPPARSGGDGKHKTKKQKHKQRRRQRGGVAG